MWKQYFFSNFHIFYLQIIIIHKKLPVIGLHFEFKKKSEQTRQSLEKVKNACDSLATHSYSHIEGLVLAGGGSEAVELNARVRAGDHRPNTRRDVAGGVEGVQQRVAQLQVVVEAVNS